mgnify:CR=1 FL=1
MEWILFALLALIMFSLSTMIDGLSIKKYLKDPKVYSFYNLFLQGFIGSLIFFFIDINFYNYSFLLVSFITGLLYVYGLLPYMKALEFEEVSRIESLFRLEPIFVLFFSYLVFNLNLNINQFVGFSFLVLGGILISIKKVNGLFRLSRGFWYMMSTNLILAGYFLGTHYLFKNHDFWSSFAFIHLGILLASLTLIIFRDYGRKGIFYFNRFSKFSKLLIIFAALLSFIGLGLRNFAISLSSSALVSSLGGFKSLFVFVLALIISFKAPHILKEETSSRVIILKVISIILFIVGVYFVSL